MKFKMFLKTLKKAQNPFRTVCSLQKVAHISITASLSFNHCNFYTCNIVISCRKKRKYQSKKACLALCAPHNKGMVYRWFIKHLDITWKLLEIVVFSQNDWSNHLKNIWSTETLILHTSASCVLIAQVKTAKSIIRLSKQNFNHIPTRVLCAISQRLRLP